MGAASQRFLALAVWADGYGERPRHIEAFLSNVARASSRLRLRRVRCDRTKMCVADGIFLEEARPTTPQYY